MIDMARLSERFEVSPLSDNDADAVLDVWLTNPQFFRHCAAEPTRDQVISDMHLTPPGISRESKLYAGLYQAGALVAILDLVFGYPDQHTCYVGFLMVRGECQGRGVGTSIVCDLVTSLRSLSYTAIRLAVDAGNPQSRRFWAKMGFALVAEVEVDGWVKLVCERAL